MENYYISGSILLGSIIIGLMLYFSLKKGSRSTVKALEQKLHDTGEENTRQQVKIEHTEKDLQKIDNDLISQREDNLKLTGHISELKNENKNLIEKLDSQKKEMEELQKKFTEAFENLANRIFDEKSHKFTRENRENLDSILKPLKEDIEKFKTKVDNINEKNRMTNTTLIEHIKNLENLNKQISEDASNLTKALKGDVKIQGNWGEVILERILEESGLRKGMEYITQGEGMKLTDEDGHRFQPDVLIKLPENKHLIVDSKVSLVHYERLAAKEDETGKLKELKQLITSVRTHIDGLFKKHYHDLKGLNSPDFVLLFLPIEGSFSVVLQNDAGIYQYALNKHIVIVSPSTLLATLRTIAFIWRQENQTRNAMEIARQGGTLYDAFVRMLEDLEKIGINLNRATGSYNDAVKRISTGKGNLLTRVENIKKLGAKANKQIPEKFNLDET